MITSFEGSLRFARAPLAAAIAVLSATTFAQDDETALEEVIVVGSQIKGIQRYLSDIRASAPNSRKQSGIFNSIA